MVNIIQNNRTRHQFYTREYVSRCPTPKIKSASQSINQSAHTTPRQTHQICIPKTQLNANKDIYSTVAVFSQYFASCPRIRIRIRPIGRTVNSLKLEILFLERLLQFKLGLTFLSNALFLHIPLHTAMHSLKVTNHQLADFPRA